MDAPDFELSTPKIDLSDALQAELSDSISGFELEPEPATQDWPRVPRKPKADDDDSVVAALLGKPIAANTAAMNTTELPCVAEKNPEPSASPKAVAGDSILAAMLGRSVSAAGDAPVEAPATVVPAIEAKAKTPEPQPESATEALIESPVLMSIAPSAPVEPELPKYPKLVTDIDEHEEPAIVAPLPKKAKLFAPSSSPSKSTVPVQPVPFFDSKPASKPVERYSAVKAIKTAPDIEQPRPPSGAWWTLPLMFAGLAIVACAVLVPAADENRRAMYELAKIERDVAYFQKQSDVNKDFLERVSNDPTLAERLALRQLHMTRSATHLVPVPTKAEPFNRSPFALVSVEPPPALEPYRPVAGKLSEWFLNVRLQIYLAGAGLLLAAAGVIFGGGEPTSRRSSEEVAA